VNGRLERSIRRQGKPLHRLNNCFLAWPGFLLQVLTKLYQLAASAELGLTQFCDCDTAYMRHVTKKRLTLMYDVSLGGCRVM
jgi:hypothetical protein